MRSRIATGVTAQLLASRTRTALSNHPLSIGDHSTCTRCGYPSGSTLTALNWTDSGGLKGCPCSSWFIWCSSLGRILSNLTCVSVVIREPVLGGGGGCIIVSAGRDGGRRIGCGSTSEATATTFLGFLLISKNLNLGQ